jgi:soluble lytic murein transglycosylase-like protein
MKRLRLAVISAALLIVSLFAAPLANAAIFYKKANGVVLVSGGTPTKRALRTERPDRVFKRKSNRVTSVSRRKIKFARKSRQGRLIARRGRATAPVSGNRGNVVALIKRMAPSYGVPTWFALRIAQIESSYNPRARGAAGEYGVYQMKCATARGIGFRGNCNALFNPQTNIQYGLKHLQLAVRLSRGNLRLAASKHNGGLGRKSLVRVYVNRVF